MRFKQAENLEDLDMERLHQLEKSTLVPVAIVYITGLIIFLFINPVIANWFSLMLVLMLLGLQVVIDFNIYRKLKDRLFATTAVISVAGIVSAGSFAIDKSVSSPKLLFSEEYMMEKEEEHYIFYENITDVTMTKDTPNVPYNHYVFGFGNHMNGKFEDREGRYVIALGDKSEESIKVVTDREQYHINAVSPETTEKWYEELKDKVQ
ncbi:hypothetical protein [Salinicoccus luteus]|uniref:hypothetical protein n=1 Tax=Salinicoccus luteus TaxID=367840 RepID=UPI0004E1D9A3|nr:hypothetical protein [Salinicoccus luteus]